MGGEQAAGVMAMVQGASLAKKGKPWSEQEQQDFKAGVVDDYDRMGNPLYASARLWDDGIIDPRDTRDVLGLSLAATLNAPVEQTHFGVFRM